MLVYLVMTPMWSRTARFTNVYASATLDGLSVILWLSAWAAVASYVSAGKNKGTNTKGSGCENFSLGSAAKCKLSEATIILGVIVMLLFCGTSYFSFQAVMHYRRTGEMPASAKPSNDFAAQTQDAFSSNLRTDEFDDEGGFDARQGGGQSGLGISRQDEDEYALLHQADNDDLGHPPPSHGTLPVPYGQGSNVSQDYNTSYGGAYGRHSPNSFQEMGSGDPPPSYGR
jgi:translocation protein SEC72